MDLNWILNEGFVIKKKPLSKQARNAEALTGTLSTVSKDSGKTIVFILIVFIFIFYSEWTEIVLKQKWETINDIWLA